MTESHCTHSGGLGMYWHNNLLCVKSYLPLGQLLSLRQFEIIQLQSITLFNFCTHFAQGEGCIDTAKVISLPSKSYLPSFLECSGTFRSRVSSIIYSLAIVHWEALIVQPNCVCYKGAVGFVLALYCEQCGQVCEWTLSPKANNESEKKQQVHIWSCCACTRWWCGCLPSLSFLR